MPVGQVKSKKAKGKKAVYGQDTYGTSLQDLHRKRDIDRITGLTKGFPINYQVHPVILSKNSCFSPFLKIFILCTTIRQVLVFYACFSCGDFRKSFNGNG